MYPEGLPSIYQAQIYTNFKALDPDRKMAKFGRRVDPGTENYHVWDVIVKSYSETLLTMPGDKLIALSGIAKRMMSAMNDEYIAGMWRKYLESALLWHVSHLEKIDGSPSSRPLPYRAPTWSWASIDGVILTVIITERSLTIKVCGVHLEHATNDPTSIVKGGWLDLRGALKPFNLLKMDYGPFERWYMTINGIPVGPQGEGLDEEDKLGPVVDLDVNPHSDNCFTDDNAKGKLFFMIGNMPTEERPYLYVLLLRLADAEKRLFERIGLATCWPKNGQEMLLSELSEEVKKSLPCLKYENGLHTIRII